jgi:uncharacterized membrane protein
LTEIVDPDSTEILIPFGINNRGQIVGNLGLHGFLLSEGTFTTIDVPGSGHTETRGINDRSQIVGLYVISGPQGSGGFFFSDGTFTTLRLPDGSEAMSTGINNQGQIVGRFTDASGVSHGFKLKIRRKWQH